MLNCIYTLLSTYERKISKVDYVRIWTFNKCTHSSEVRGLCLMKYSRKKSFKFFHLLIFFSFCAKILFSEDIIVTALNFDGL